MAASAILAELSGQPLLSDERGTLASLRFMLPSSSPLPLRRAVGGGAATFSSTRSLIQRQQTNRDCSRRGGRGALISLDTPPPARFRDRTPHGGRLLTLLGRACDSALHRPEPPRRAVPLAPEAAGAAARADSGGWRVGARSGGSDRPAAAAHVVGEPRVVASGRAGEGARVDSVVRMVECAYVVEHR